MIFEPKTMSRLCLPALLAALPGAPHRPNQLAAELGTNRAVARRVLNATGKRNPLEAWVFSGAWENPADLAD